MNSYPLEVKALRVEQPIGVYYVAVLPARVLLDVAFSDVLTATLADGQDAYALYGTQRLLEPQRLRAIADYINRADAAFPNCIILAANYRQQDGLLEDDDPDIDQDASTELTQDLAGGAKRRWAVKTDTDGCFTLSIPTADKLAAIIDGQHRLFAYAEARTQRLDMQLICAVFLDLPKPLQAQLFATINSTQKPVPKSLTYELFGYNVDEEDELYWSPDKLAVFLTRKLASDPKSPLRGRIIVAPKRDEALAALTSDRGWKVSTAVVVEGIMRLITTDPKKDTTNLLDGRRKTRREIAAVRKDRSPLRGAYLEGQDAVIYTMTLNYLIACDQLFWRAAQPGSFITRTIGVQALFDILRELARDAYEQRDISVDYFVRHLTPAAGIDFAAAEFQNASGSGRSTIRKAIRAAISQAAPDQKVQ